MEVMRIVGKGRIVGKTSSHWIIDRDGVDIFIPLDNMIPSRPEIGLSGILTYEYRRSSSMVNCFRAEDDPLVAEGQAIKETARQRPAIE
jgi:hypothetical protein